VVTVTVTGSGDVQAVKIAPEVVDPDDVEMLEDLVLAAVSDGLRRAQELQQESLGGVTGGLDLGGLGGLLG
jgi:DNA-binding protein YbaB